MPKRNGLTHVCHDRIVRSKHSAGGRAGRSAEASVVSEAAPIAVARTVAATSLVAIREVVRVRVMRGVCALAGEVS